VAIHPPDEGGDHARVGAQPVTGALNNPQLGMFFGRFE
jgi:hypothetical protein